MRLKDRLHLGRCEKLENAGRVWIVAARNLGERIDDALMTVIRECPDYRDTLIKSRIGIEDYPECSFMPGDISERGKHVRRCGNAFPHTVPHAKAQ